MTLQQLIDRHEVLRAAQPVSTALSPLGTATVAAHRLARALADLDQKERLHVLGLLADLTMMPAPTDPAA
jgi:hypothetical protein